MTATIVDGRALAAVLTEELKERISALAEPPALTIFLVGEDSGSARFVSRKEKLGVELGVSVAVRRFLSDITTDELQTAIAKEARVHPENGLVVQLPLPAQIETDQVLTAIPTAQDVDGLTSKSPYCPAVVLAILHTLEQNNVLLRDATVAVVGAKGRLVGRPISAELKLAGAQVVPIEQDTPDPATLLRQADIIISGVGQPNLIQKEDVRPGAVVIDAGFSVINGRVTGDIAPDVAERASLITPVPGGIGPLTTAALFQNVLFFAENRQKGKK